MNLFFFNFVNFNVKFNRKLIVIVTSIRALDLYYRLKPQYSRFPYSFPTSKYCIHGCDTQREILWLCKIFMQFVILFVSPYRVDWSNKINKRDWKTLNIYTLYLYVVCIYLHYVDRILRKCQHKHPHQVQGLKP